MVGYNCKLPANRCPHPELHKNAKPSSNQRRPETAKTVLGISTVLPKGWSELCQIFRVHYASELPFVHLPSLVGPYLSTIDGPLDAHVVGYPPKTTPRLYCNSSGMVLAFLALTLRHCRDRLFEYVRSNSQGLDSGTALSAHFAVLANRFLAAHAAGASCSDVEGVQLRLMLASYDWSMGKSERARQLLSEANVTAHELGIHQCRCTKPGPLTISVALAFEAESMGLCEAPPVSQDQPSIDDIDEEVKKRTSWCCFLMDTQYSLGEHRSKFICDAAKFPPFPNCEDHFTAEAQTYLLSEDAQLEGEQAMDMSTASPSENLSESCDPLSPSKDYYSTLTPLHRLLPSSNRLNTSDDNTLHFYIRCVSVLHRISQWTRSNPWRFVFGTTPVSFH